MDTKKKTGRPKKEVIKDVFRNIRFTKEEDAEITAKAEEAGISRSDFIRKAVFGKKVVSKDTTKTLNQQIQILRNIGVNLNAIAKRANTVDADFNISFLQKTIEECNNFLAEIKILRDEYL